ncbi:chemotaxis protein [Escherichia coli]|nr:chemotaxis protein [Escherichia coli]
MAMIDPRTPSGKLTLRYRGLPTVTNGAIVIHTQRLKSDPGGNLLS